MGYQRDCLDRCLRCLATLSDLYLHFHLSHLANYDFFWGIMVRVPGNKRSLALSSNANSYQSILIV